MSRLSSAEGGQPQDAIKHEHATELVPQTFERLVCLPLRSKLKHEQYESCIYVLKDLGIPLKCVDIEAKSGSATCMVDTEGEEEEESGSTFNICRFMMKSSSLKKWAVR
ncbi:hypothetical protein K1719_014374 [Acacia pycnantha]|nr:hypothetical protein K1719_014374 [Acacia pycnantha]